MRELETISEEETEQFGAELATELAGGAVVALVGDLGAGKTALARGIARGLGIDEPVTSPTFTIVQEYQGREWRLYHVDLYRIADAAQAFAFGFGDYLDDPEAVCVVEWAERLGPELPPHAVRVDVTHRGPERRLIRVATGGD